MCQHCDATELAEPAAPPREPIVCAVCSQREEHGSCACRICNECLDTVENGEECAECQRCASCCECWTCGSGRREHACASDLNPCSRCERCPDHCECSHCESCSDPCDGTCSRCDRCDSCCDCCHCDHCSDPCESICGDCDGCEDCCHCSDSERNVDLLERSEPHFHSARKNQFADNPSRRFLACELEIAKAADSGTDVYDAVQKWQGSIVEDGSLPETGFEICTAPANGDLFLSQIKEICSALHAQGCEVNRECGYHVHADARDLNWHDMRRFVLLYARVETALFSLVPPLRRQSPYCQPCGALYAANLDNPRAPKKFLDNVYKLPKQGKARANGLKSIRRKKYCVERYHALNLHSWFYRGTVECRLACGTTDPDKVIHWALLWGALTDWAARATEKDLRALPSDPWECLLSVAPASTRPWLAERRAKFAQTPVNLD